MSLRKHLVDHHANEADHHVRHAKSCVKMAEHHDAMAKCMSLGADVRQHHEEMRDCYKEMGAEHTRMAEHHVNKCRECSTMDFGEEHSKVTKIASDADRFARDEDGVVGVRPGVPEGLRLIGRAGVDPEEIAKSNAEKNLAQHPAFARRTA